MVYPTDAVMPDVLDMGTIFLYTNTHIYRMRYTIDSSNGMYKATCTTIFNSLEYHRDHLCIHTS